MRATEPPVLDPEALTTREELASALTLLRERSGRTVRDIARSAEIPVATAGGYFSGRHLPPLAAMDQFARLLLELGVSEDEASAWTGAANRLRRAPGRRPTSARSPYRGLAAYEPDDAELFFGREQLTADLVARTVAGPSTPVVVIGSSGSGTSSVLRAGLAAAVLDRGGLATVTTPGADPLSWRGSLLEQSFGAGQVLVVDQLEELLTAEVSQAEAASVVDTLAALHAGGVVVVAGLRADFFERALEIGPLAHWLTENQVLVGPLSTEALRRVVTEPARIAGIEVEDSLVEVLIAEATAGSPSTSSLEPGALPLLSHALYVTWLAASGRRLTLAQYRAAGGLAGAIAKTAESVHGSLTPAQRAVERATLLRLVHVRDGVATTRRPGAVRDFSAPPQSDVVAAYVEARLLTSDRGHVQIAHEALLEAWPRLRTWLDSGREGLRTHSRLAEAAQQWSTAREDPELLYRGSALESAVAWAFGSGEAPGLSTVEAAFLAASQATEAQRRKNSI